MTLTGIGLHPNVWFYRFGSHVTRFVPDLVYNAVIFFPGRFTVV